jgi:hypothetical protein
MALRCILDEDAFEVALGSRASDARRGILKNRNITRGSHIFEFRLALAGQMRQFPSSLAAPGDDEHSRAWLKGACGAENLLGFPDPREISLMTARNGPRHEHLSEVDSGCGLCAGYLQLRLPMAGPARGL